MAFKISRIAEGVENQATTMLQSHQWKSVRIEFSDGDDSILWGLRGISWGTTVDTNVIKGLKDATVINEVYNKVYTGTMTVLQSEIERWYTANPVLRGYSLVDFDRFDVIVTLPSNDQNNWSKTTLRGCRFTNDERSYSQSSGEPEAALSLSISSIISEASSGTNPDA